VQYKAAKVAAAKAACPFNRQDFPILPSSRGGESGSLKTSGFAINFAIINF